MKRLITLLCLISACSPKVHPPDADALKPSWLKGEPYREGYYTGIGHSLKDGTNNYIQAAKKSALEDLASQIRVNVSSTSVVSRAAESNERSAKATVPAASIVITVDERVP